MASRFQEWRSSMRLIAIIVNFSKLFDSRPIFEIVNEKLKWVGLYNLTTFTLGKNWQRACHWWRPSE